MVKKKFFFIALTAFLSQTALSAPILHTSDFINTVDRTNIVDFERMGSTTTFGSTFTQDSVTVNQVNGVAGSIWTTCGSSCWFSNNTMTWYPDGGDHGWTEIVKADASDFLNIGLDLGSGFSWGGQSVQYELLDDGLSVLLGFITTPTSSDGYIGFSGGGFDQIRLRNTFSSGNFGDGALNALAIDNIELSGSAPASVPEPGTLALLGLGLGFIGRIFTATPQSLRTAPTPEKSASENDMAQPTLFSVPKMYEGDGVSAVDPSILSS